MHFIGVDLGSTSIKGGVLDLERQTVDHVNSLAFPNPIPADSPNVIEIAPDEIVDSTRALIDQLLAKAPDAHGIFFCGQMGGLLLSDLDGRALTPYISWRDQRTTAIDPTTGQSTLDDLLGRTSPEELIAIGNEIKPGSSSALLYWLNKNGKLPSESFVVLNLGDYVLSALCGSPPVTESTLALGTLLLGVGKLDFAREWFNQFAFKRTMNKFAGEQVPVGGNQALLHWPRLASPWEIAGTYFHGGRKYPCYPCVGDQQAALYGTGLKPGELSVNVSTGSQVSQITSAFLPGKYQTRTYLGGGYLNTITHLPAGRALNGLVSLLTEIPRLEGIPLANPWSVIAREISKVEATDLEIDLAFFSSSVGDRGAIRQMRLENMTIGHLFLGAFERMAQTYSECANRLDPNKKCERVVISGGLPQKFPILKQKITEKIGLPSRSVDQVEETLSGLLGLASVLPRS